MILTKYEIKELIEKDQMITNYIDLDKQLNDHGFDITVDKIYRIVGYAVIDFYNKHRKLPDYQELDFKKVTIPRTNEVVDGVCLSDGSYVIEINEIVKLPKNICAIVLPRSTLIRSGIKLFSAVWDAGYHGKGKLLLEVVRPCIITKNARIGQMVFFKLSKEVEGYNGSYQLEGLK